MDENENSYDQPFAPSGQQENYEPPAEPAVTQKEFDAFRQEFNVFKQKTEALTKIQPPAPVPEDSSSSFVEYLPWIIVGILTVVVTFIGLKLYSVIGQLNWLTEQYKKLIEPPAAEEKKPIVSYSEKPLKPAIPKNNLTKNTPPPSDSVRTPNLAVNSAQKNTAVRPSEEKPRNLFSGVDFITQCVKEFNAADETNPAQSRGAFARKYNVMAFSCTNANERLNNSSLKPQFGGVSSINSGEYWAVPLGENRYAVFPNVKAYSWNIHSLRAMSYFFNAVNFDADSTYNKIFVDSPAEMYGNFECTVKGILRLSND